MIILGLDIGSNSVGSAWVDTDKEEIAVGVSVFPAGVDETEDARGAPKNQDRRSKRSLRRTLARRSTRKRQTRKLLSEYGLLPSESKQLKKLFSRNPWHLRRRGVDKPLTAHEFGRILVHLGQRRGALGVDADADDDGKVKKAIDKTRMEFLKRYATQEQHANLLTLHESEEKDDRGRFAEAFHEWFGKQQITFGRLMADLMDERRHELVDEQGRPKTGPNGDRSHYHDPVRNRFDDFQFHADRAMIRDEFARLWKRQSEPDGALAHLTEKRRDELKYELDNPQRDDTWRHKGTIFGQRDTYWDTGTLGRCDLEPTDRCVPIADRHASYFRVLETVNNIRIQGPQDDSERSLREDERNKVIDRLRRQKTGSAKTVRKALGIDKQSLKKQDIPEDAWSLNLEKDEDREINTDWFHRDIVLGAIGEDQWSIWSEQKREGLNRAILKCDPKIDEDAGRLRGIAGRMELDGGAIERLIEAWRGRPKLEKRLNLSRKAVLNLMPYIEQQSPDGRWPTHIEARKLFAEDGDNSASDAERQRYRIGAQTLTKADRHYLSKHPNELPPAPALSNPVVRKAIHEVRRHVIEHIRVHGGKKPDRICIEFARETTKPKKLSDRILWLNRKRDRIRKAIIDEVVKPTFGEGFNRLSHNQLQTAIDRVLLARQQRGQCAYSGNQHGTITDRVAAKGTGSGGALQIDHIIPRAVGGRNSWSNRVLCWDKSNYDKGKKTLRKWWRQHFDDRIRPMAFMATYAPASSDPNEYFTKADYAAKWKNLSREDVPKDWRGSQLTDTAYAARQVQSYLQSALWPNEQSHLAGGQRRIFVSKGAYTHQLRKDWQLFQSLIDPSQESQQEVRQASLKNRGDHREHAIDAVAIALIAEPGSVVKGDEQRPSTRLDDLAHYLQAVEEARFKAKEQGRDPRGIKRDPLPPPWSDVNTFRRQVMSLIYDKFDSPGEGGSDGRSSQPIVVSHRPVGRRIVGKFHEDTIFGPVPDMENTYVGRKAVTELTPKHLREPVPEKKKDSIDRLTQNYLESGLETTKAKARRRAKVEVEAPEFKPPLVDPPPGKSGLVRDVGLRRQLRKCIESFEYTETDRDGNVNVRRKLKPDEFTQKEIKQAFEKGAFHPENGVPIKRVKLLRTMTDPVIIHRKKWDDASQCWVRDTGKDGNLSPDIPSRADRAYVGGNNHHIEIREDERGKWSGTIISMFEAARRVRIEKRDAVDRSDDPEKRGRFIMSLAEGEVIRMRSPKMKVTSPREFDYFRVVKLDKPATIVFAHHADARPQSGNNPVTGEKLSRNPMVRLKPSKKEGKKAPHPALMELIAVSPADLRSLTVESDKPPQKMRVTPLGEPIPLSCD